MDIIFPKLNDADTDDGVIDQVLVGVGDTVTEGMPVVAVEMEKAVVEIESPHAGTVKQITVAEGDEVNVGDVLIVLE